MSANSGPSSVPLSRPTPAHQPHRPAHLDFNRQAARMQASDAHPAHGLGKPFVPFNMAEVAAAAMARPRSSAPWAERDESSHCPDSPTSSAGSSPFSSAPGSPITQPSSCALTPSSSSEGFSLSAPPRPAPKCPVETRLLPSAPVASTSTLPITPPTPASDEWSATDFSLKLLFTNGNNGGRPASAPLDDEDDHSLPPAFFPSQRISFAPRLRITSPHGLPYSSLGGMQLGVTGMCETLDGEGRIKSKRMIADFCIDLSSGLNVWKRDAQSARRKQGQQDEEEGHERLPAGTYRLPLSMKIPDSDRLPPSFECDQFRVHYTMSIAIFSAATSSTGTPRRLKVFSLPFHVLPSTLPSPAPELPVLSHENKKGVFASLIKSLSFSAPKAETGYHIVYPSLPTSHFSPGAHASVPVSLRIVDRPLEPTDLYIRLAIVRKTYVRESQHTSMQAAIEDEWGLGTGVSMAALGYPEEVIVEPWCKDEEEVVSRWGWVPYSSRPGADPTEKAEVIIKDIALPLSGLTERGWSHGYSTSLDLEPSEVPSQAHGDCSWFSPAFRNRPPVAKEYGRHVHVSTRFFLSIEVGFASPQLGETLRQLGEESPDMEIPAPNTFTSASCPRTSSHSGFSTANPFFTPSSRHRQTSPSSAAASLDLTPPSPLAFPGKLRELFIPLTIGSVAEPTMACISGREAESAQRRAEREAREERGEDTRNEGEGPDGAWLCAPPAYDEACQSAPYVY